MLLRYFKNRTELRSMIGHSLQSFAALSPQVTHKKTDSFVLELSGIRYRIKNWEALHILKEIHLAQVYRLPTSTNREKIRVIDIGMNTGMSSLHFAKLDQVERVYGFEAFRKTYYDAEWNFEINPELSKKIERYPFGLSDEARVMSVPYDQSAPGSMSIAGPRSQTRFAQPLPLEALRVESASRILRPILESHPNANWVLKSDCEGSEYAILEDLSQSGLLRYFETILLEWHDRGPDPLVSLLEQSGMNHEILPSSDPKIGMIRAWRNA